MADKPSELEEQFSPLAQVARTVKGMLWSAFPPREVDLSPMSHQAETACEIIIQTDLGLSAYLMRTAENSPGARYLAIYGALQALFVQQDATRHLCEALGHEYPLMRNDRIREIRALRNAAVGHPSRQEREVPATVSNYVIAPNAVPDKIIVIANYHDNRARPNAWIDLPNVIQDQRSLLVPVLERLREYVEEVWQTADDEEYFGPQ